MPDPRHRHSGYEPTDPPPPPPRRKAMGVEIREKADDTAPSSISPSGLLGWGVRHGRSWNPIGVAIMFALMVAAVALALEYTSAGKAIVNAVEANTTAVVRNTAKVEKLQQATDASIAANAEIAKVVREIQEHLDVQGKGDATTRIVRLEKNENLLVKAVVELNGGRFNPSFPRADKDDFQREPDGPAPLLPRFKTDQQWALKPE